MRSKYQTLGEFIIENQNEFEYSTGELSRLINAIRLAEKEGVGSTTPASVPATFAVYPEMK